MTDHRPTSKGSTMHKFAIGDRVFHRHRDQHGAYEGLTDESGTVWVKFEDGDSEKVSRDQLVPDLMGALKASLDRARRAREARDAEDGKD